VPDSDALFGRTPHRRASGPEKSLGVDTIQQLQNADVQTSGDTEPTARARRARRLAPVNLACGRK
jgi:hypothetical protein